jgi:hypothetical protein
MKQKKVLKGLLLWLVVPAALFFGSYTMLGPLFVETAPPGITEKLANAVGKSEGDAPAAPAIDEPALSNDKFRAPKNFSVTVSKSSSRADRSSSSDGGPSMGDVDTSSILDDAVSEDRPRRRTRSSEPTRTSSRESDSSAPDPANSDASGADEAGAGGATDPANGDPDGPPGN